MMLPRRFLLLLLGDKYGLPGLMVHPDPVCLELSEISKELSEGRYEVIIALPSHGDGQHVVVLRFQHYLSLIEDAEGDHGLLLELPHLPAISLDLDPDLLISLNLHVLHDVR